MPQKMRIDEVFTHKFQRHLCLVSAQPTPNITPLLDVSFQPDEVILLVSSDMQARAEFLIKVLQPSGIRVSTWPIDDAWDIEHIQNRVFALLEEDDSSIVLNATGGTKPMSIAAYEVFRGLGLPIFYVHPEKDRVLWMYPKDVAAFDIENRIKLPQFLLAHGVEVNDLHRQPVPKVWRELTAILIEDIDVFTPAFGLLNYFSMKTHRVSHHEKTRCVTIPSEKWRWSAFQSLVEVFEQAGVLYVEKDRLFFHNEACRFFTNGGWLEHHVYAVVKNLRSKQRHIHDVAQAVVVQRDTVKNEIDVAFLCDNALFVIECKTSQLLTSKAKEKVNASLSLEAQLKIELQAADATALYKLDSIVHAMGGLRAKAMLVSYRDVAKCHHERAAKESIAICAGKQLQQLAYYISQWIR